MRRLIKIYWKLPLHIEQKNLTFFITTVGGLIDNDQGYHQEMEVSFTRTDI